MRTKARLYSCARSWPLLALWALLSPALSSASPPVDVSLQEVSSLKPREALATAVAWLSDDAPRSHARGSKIHIGRIFFSPAERRQRRADKTPATDAPNTTHTARAERLVVNGAVSSSTKGRAVWVNGAAIENSASAWADRAGKVWLRDDKHAPHSVRPGQAIDPASGAIEDLLPAGSVARH